MDPMPRTAKRLITRPRIVADRPATKNLSALPAPGR
jgi:hypothetical protein